MCVKMSKCVSTDAADCLTLDLSGEAGVHGSLIHSSALGASPGSVGGLTQPSSAGKYYAWLRMFVRIYVFERWMAITQKA